MKHLVLTLAAAFIAAITADSATATPVRGPQSRAEYCRLAAQPADFMGLAEDHLNHMAFQNEGGLFGGGVCWWHSLFQRAAWYLAVFRPELPKPNRYEAKFIVHQLARGKDVIVIPGYRNFFEFSSAHRGLIQAKLDQWQLTDGGLKFGWLNGVLKRSTMPPVELRDHMDVIAKQVNTSREVQWTMWQVPGIAAHSSLFLRVHPASAGSTSEIVDSNFPGLVNKLDYSAGSDGLDSYLGPIIPYLSRTKDLKRFAKARKRYCTQGAAVYTQAEKRKILDEKLDNDWD